VAKTNTRTKIVAAMESCSLLETDAPAETSTSAEIESYSETETAVEVEAPAEIETPAEVKASAETEAASETFKNPDAKTGKSAEMVPTASKSAIINETLLYRKEKVDQMCVEDHHFDFCSKHVCILHFLVTDTYVYYAFL